MIEVNGLRFAYGKGEEVLKGIDFDCEDDCIISILGPNGTGKTTFLKCLCGVYKPTHGSIKVNGKDTSTLRGRELAKEIGFVPQSVPVSDMSVFDAILVGRKPYIDWMARATKMFACMIPGEARVFPRDELDQAKAWVAGTT